MKAGWTEVALGDVALIDRRSVSPDSVESGTTYVGLENISIGGSWNDVSTVDAGQLKSSKFRFSPDHVLFGKLRPNLAKIAAPNFEGICSTDILPILPSQGLNRRYLLYWLRTPKMVSHASRLASGANLPRINPKSVQKIPIPLPPIEEQRRITAILDAADALRAKRRQAIAKVESLTQAIFIDMFGDPVANPRGWREVPLSSAVADGTKVTYGIVQAGAEDRSGVPYIRTGDIKDGQILVGQLRRTAPSVAERFPRSRVREREIVMSIRATVGTTALVPSSLDGANLTQGTARIAPGSMTSPWFLLEYLRSEGTQRWIERQVKGATFREITLGRLRQLPVQLPPLELQGDFENRIESLTLLRQRIHDQNLELDTLFESLQQRAFRGDL